MYVPTVGPPDAKVFLVGEGPGEEEDKAGKPFMPHAPAGRTMTKLVEEAGSSRVECLVGNVARERPPGNKMAFYFEDKKMLVPKPILQGWLEELKYEIHTYKPNIVVAFGDHAMWALMGVRGIKAKRGYIYESTLVPGVKILPTWHPSAVNRVWKERYFVTTLDLRKAFVNSEHPGLPRDDRKLNSSPSRIEFIEFLKYLYFEHKDPIALDVETRNPGSHIDILGLADSPKHAMSMQMLSGKNPKFEIQKELEIWQWVAKICNEKPLIMQNAVFDMGVLWYNNNIFCRNLVSDIMIAAHCLWPEMPRSLHFLASICINVPAWKHTAETFPTLYNAADATNTYGIWEVVEDLLDKFQVRHTFDFEMAQIRPATKLQLDGVEVDLERKAEVSEDIGKKIGALESELDQQIGRTINLNSHKQLANLLYIEMGLPAQHKRRKSVSEQRKLTVNEEALVKLARLTSNPLLLKIIAWKKLHKLKRDFIDIETSPEGKVHTSYNITGATMQKQKKGLVIDDEDSYKSFGRWSSSKSIILPYGSGNLQNIPYAARKIYRKKGYVYLMADYAQAEAVVVAYLINDQRMIQLFQESFGLPRAEREKKNLDIHKWTASSNFGIALEDITKEQREIGKVIRHATNYSAGPGVLSYKLNCSMNEAKKLLQQFFNTCPQLHLWHLRIQDTLRKTRTLVNLLGRRHTFLDRWGDDLFRSAYSYKPQSTVGDLLNRSLTLIYDEHGDWLDIKLQLHDAVYVLIEENSHKIDEGIQAMRECMLYEMEANGIPFTIDVDFSLGPSWGELEEL